MAHLIFWILRIAPHSHTPYIRHAQTHFPVSKTLLVTGSSGLIGSEVCAYIAREFGYTVHGVDNNQRSS